MSVRGGKKYRKNNQRTKRYAKDCFLKLFQSKGFLNLNLIPNFFQSIERRLTYCLGSTLVFFLKG